MLRRRSLFWLPFHYQHFHQASIVFGQSPLRRDVLLLGGFS